MHFQSSPSPHVKFYTIADIKNGDEVCVSYRPDVLFQPTPQRQAFLRQGWEFDCDCPRYVNDHLSSRE
jgi:SET domain-containing protein